MQEVETFPSVEFNKRLFKQHPKPEAKYPIHSIAHSKLMPESFVFLRICALVSPLRSNTNSSYNVIHQCFQDPKASQKDH